MYTNVAYLGKKDEDIVILSKPLIITAVGYYKILSRKIEKTFRPTGRGDYQLLYVAAGKVHFFFDGHERIIQKGNMVLFRPGVPQIYHLCAADNPETYWVHFTGSQVEELLDYHNMPKDECVFFTGTSPDYPWIFRKMIQELQLQRVNYEDFINLGLQQLLLVISRYLCENNNIKTEILNEIERAIHFFLDNYNKNIIIEDYAKKHGMTANWFTQSFKKVTKYTPMQYIVSLRMANAMNMLNNTNYNITQIAASVGYPNSLYFSRVFKNYTGVSPTEYRKTSRQATDTL